MASSTIRRDEGAALVLALALHAGLVAWLALTKPPAPLPLPERMTVTISEEVAATSTSPDPAASAAPDEAPEIGRAPPPPAPLPQPSVAPRPPEKLAPPPPSPKPAPRPVATKAPPPPPKQAAQRPPAKWPFPTSSAAPRQPPAKGTAKPAPKTAVTPPKKPGGSRLGQGFLDGVPGATAKGPAKTPPAATIGPQVRTALSAAILRQIKPKWQGRVPQGVDTEKLVTIVSIALNPDGSLAGEPRVLGQEGITDSNRSQAKRHAEEAVKALQLAAPFDLPADLYEGWKKPPPIRMRKSI